MTTWNTDIHWHEGVATTNHVELPDQPQSYDAISALREYLDARDLTATRETSTPHCLSWDVVDYDGNKVGAAAIALADPE